MASRARAKTWEGSGGFQWPGDSAPSPLTFIRWPDWSSAARQASETSGAENSSEISPAGPALLPILEEISEERLQQLCEQVSTRNLSSWHTIDIVRDHGF